MFNKIIEGCLNFWKISCMSVQLCLFVSEASSAALQPLAVSQRAIIKSIQNTSSRFPSHVGPLLYKHSRS